MLRKLVLVCAVLSVSCLSVYSQETSKAEFFGGYQYLRINSGIQGADSVNHQRMECCFERLIHAQSGRDRRFQRKLRNPVRC